MQCSWRRQQQQLLRLFTCAGCSACMSTCHHIIWSLIWGCACAHRLCMCVIVQVSATIHLANRNWAALVDDFIDLEFLPTDANRRVITSLVTCVVNWPASTQHLHEPFGHCCQYHNSDLRWHVPHNMHAGWQSSVRLLVSSLAMQPYGGAFKQLLLLMLMLLQGCDHPCHGARAGPLPEGRRRQGLQFPGGLLLLVRLYGLCSTTTHACSAEPGPPDHHAYHMFCVRNPVLCSPA